MIRSTERETMFQGFQAKASDFFWELCFHNEREWFHAHKEQFDALIGTPMKDLAADTYALLIQRFPLLDAEVHVSRIWRDARRLYGRGPLKENLWFSIENAGVSGDGPSFYFEIEPAVFSYGMGFWCPRAEQMELFRKSVDANPAAFERLASQVAEMEGFGLGGPFYKRPKGDFGEVVNAWYNRKSTYVFHEENFGGALLTPEMPFILADAFEHLMPMYDYLLSHATLPLHKKS